jgi:hypothetical protein
MVVTELIGATEVRAVASIHENDLILLDEQWHLNLDTGLNGSWLSSTRGAISLETRLCVGDLEGNRCR